MLSEAPPPKIISRRAASRHDVRHYRKLMLLEFGTKALKDFDLLRIQ